MINDKGKKLDVTKKSTKSWEFVKKIFILAFPSSSIERILFKKQIQGTMLIVYIATGALLLGATLIIGSNFIAQRGRK